MNEAMQITWPGAFTAVVITALIVFLFCVAITEKWPWD